MVESMMLVTGGAGFIGSHLTEELLKEGQKVAVIDNFSNGKTENIQHLRDNHSLARAQLSIDKLVKTGWKPTYSSRQAVKLAAKALAEAN